MVAFSTLAPFLLETLQSHTRRPSVMMDGWMVFHKFVTNISNPQMFLIYYGNLECTARSVPDSTDTHLDKRRMAEILFFHFTHWYNPKPNNYNISGTVLQLILCYCCSVVVFQKCIFLQITEK